MFVTQALGILRASFGIVSLVAISSGCKSSASLSQLDDWVNPAPALEVELEAAEGWQAVVALDTGGVGIWTVLGVDIADDWGGQEVIAADDEGRAWLLVPYSGRWTAMPAVHDRKWLGALTVAEFDPSHTGRELMAGGESGKLYQVSYYLEGGSLFIPACELRSKIGQQATQANIVVVDNGTGLIFSTSRFCLCSSVQ